MTCIVACIDRQNNNVVIGGDSALVGGYDIHPMKNPKVFKNGAYAFGIAGSARMGNLLQHKFQPPTYTGQGDLHQFMVDTFVEKARVLLKDGGNSFQHGGELFPGAFYVAYQDRFFVVESDFQVSEMIDPFHAIGVGAEIARGSLAATAMSNMPAQKRAEIALVTASRYNGGVCAPYNYVTS